VKPSLSKGFGAWFLLMGVGSIVSALASNGELVLWFIALTFIPMGLFLLRYDAGVGGRYVRQPRRGSRA